MTDIDPDDYKMHAFRVALQYYGTGRYAVACNFTPVSANLLHHAVELCLKGCLAPILGVAALRGYSHDIRKLWSIFRENFPDESLASFDQLIQELHNFEQIRYPESLIKGGGFFSVGFPSGARNVQLLGPKLPEYNLSVEDVDRLIKQFFVLGNLNPEFYSLLRQEHAARYFSYLNKTPLL